MPAETRFVPFMTVTQFGAFHDAAINDQSFQRLP